MDPLPADLHCPLDLGVVSLLVEFFENIKVVREYRWLCSKVDGDSGDIIKKGVPQWGAQNSALEHCISYFDFV